MVNYPGSLDNLTNPAGTNNIGTPDHAQQHADANDAIEALEAKVGVGAGTPTLANKLLVATGNGASTWSGTVGTATINNSTFGTPLVTGGTINIVTMGTPTITGGVHNNASFGTPIVTVGSDATGDIFYRSSGSTVARLGIGASGNVLASNGTTPSWVSNSLSSIVDEDNSGASSTSSSTFANITGADVSLITTATSHIVLIATIDSYANAGSSVPYGIQWHNGTSNIGIEMRAEIPTGNSRVPITTQTIVQSQIAGTSTYTVQHRSQNNSATVTAESVNLVAFTLPA